MSAPPETISKDGSVWNVYRAGEDPVPFNVDGADLTGITVIMKVNGGPTITLVPNPEIPTGKLVVFSLADLAAIPARGADFYIQNPSSPTPMRPYLTGKIFAHGFQ